MKKLKPWLVLTVIFIAGALSGSALTFALAPHFHHPPAMLGMSHRIMGRLTQELGLSSDQQQKIQPIVDQLARQIRDAHMDEMKHDGELIKATNDQLTPLLTADQKAKLDKLEAAGDNMFQNHMKSWGPGSDHDHFHSGDPGHNEGGPPPPDGAPPPPPPSPPPPPTPPTDIPPKT